MIIFLKKIKGTSLVIKNGAWILFGKTVSAIASVAIMLVFANLISKETYGAYNYILSFFAMASIFSLPGLNTIISRSFAKKEEGVLKIIEKEKFKWSLLGSLFLFILGAWYLIKLNYTLGISFIIGGIFLPVEQIVRLSPYIWEGRMNFKKQGIYESIGFFVPAIILILTIINTDNLTIIIISYFLSYAVIRGILYFKTRSTIQKGQVPVDLQKDLSFGKHLTYMQVIQNLAGQLDKVILWHFSGPVAVAIFSFAQMPVGQLRDFFPINTLALPRLSKMTKEEAKKKSLKKFFLLFLVFIPTTAGIILLAPFIYKIVFPSYIDSVKYFQLLSLGILLTPFNLLITNFISHTNTGALYKIKTVSPIIKISLYVVLVPFYGIYGIVCATLMGHFVESCMVYYFFKKI